MQYSWRHFGVNDCYWFRLLWWRCHDIEHYSVVMISAMASEITGVSIVYATVSSGADQGKHQSSASLASVRGIHRWPVNFPHKVPVTRKMFPFDDIILETPSALLAIRILSQRVNHGELCLFLCFQPEQAVWTNSRLLSDLGHDAHVTSLKWSKAGYLVK